MRIHDKMQQLCFIGVPFQVASNHNPAYICKNVLKTESPFQNVDKFIYYISDGFQRKHSGPAKIGTPAQAAIHLSEPTSVCSTRMHGEF